MRHPVRVPAGVTGSQSPFIPWILGLLRPCPYFLCDPMWYKFSFNHLFAWFSEEISNCSIREHYVLFGSWRWLTEPDQTHGLLHARPGCSLCLAEAATAAALSAPDSPRDLSFHTHSPFAQHADPSTFCLCLKNSSLRLKTLPVICSLTTGRPADPCLPAQQPVSYSTNVPDSNCARL